MREMKPHELKRSSKMYHSHGIQKYIFLTILMVKGINCSSFFSKHRPQSKWTGSNTDLHKSGSNKSQDQDRYASLPPTVFSPDGRLYNVERTAKKASDVDDLSSSLVLAFTFGSEEEQCVMILSTSSMSPHLYRCVSPNDDDMRSNKRCGEISISSGDDNTETDDAATSEIRSLFRNGAPLYSSGGAGGKAQLMNQPTMPLAMVSWNIIVGTGGVAADSIVFNRRIRELSLSLHRSNDGIRTDDTEPNQPPMNSFHSSALARKVADMVQSPTQTVGGSNGKMLASAAMIIGGNEMPKAAQSALGHNIWRIDPTGQFWKCNAAAVGRGAGNAEATFLRQVEKWKRGKKLGLEQADHESTEDQTGDLDSLVNNLTNNDVKGYFQTLSFDEAMVLACRCCASALKMSKKKSIDSNFLEESGIQGLIIRKMKRRETVYHEMIHSDIMKEAMKLALET
mmetsp:Transcript_23780/g.28057  ORF Transcript_23780/g.28057 Transcript_23780/m.28057 type:complete len:453 (+) Transcript_23780:41-1399(+)